MDFLIKTVSCSHQKKRPGDLKRCYHFFSRGKLGSIQIFSRFRSSYVLKAAKKMAAMITGDLKRH